MCVIAFAETVRPTPEMVAKMFAKNPEGAGIAWRETVKDKDGDEYVEVVWEKGLNLAQIQKYVAEVPLPFVAHFRISSCEKPAKKYLCHPFPIENEAPTWMSGRTGGYVLFHNGHYGGWKQDLKETLRGYGGKMPGDGKFTDTRAMALICSYMGKGYMDLIDAKGIAFGPQEIEMFWGSNGWVNIDGVWCSNDAFTSSYVNSNDVTGASSVGGTRPSYYSGHMCRANSCYETQNLDDRGFCPEHGFREGPSVSVQKQGEVTTPPSQKALNTGLCALPPARPAVAAKSTSEAKGGPRSNDPFVLLAIAARDWKLAQQKHETLDGNGNRLLGKRGYKRAKKLYEKARYRVELARSKGLLPQEPEVSVKNLH